MKSVQPRTTPKLAFDEIGGGCSLEGRGQCLLVAEAVEQFRGQLGAAIDSVEFVKRALDRQVPENDRRDGLA